MSGQPVIASTQSLVGNQDLLLSDGSRQISGSTVPFEFWGDPVYQLLDGTLFCPGFTGLTYPKNVWDSVGFGLVPLPFGGGTVSTPGIAMVSVEKRMGIDRKKPSGQDGARVTALGVDLAEIQIQLLIWTPEQLKVLNGLWPILMPKAGKGQLTPLGVYHPQFKTHDIKSLVVIGGRGPEPGPMALSKVFTILALEFMPPGKSNVTHTPVATKGSTFDAPATPTPGTNPANTDP